MFSRSYLSSKLEKIIFIEIKNSAVKEIFNYEPDQTVNFPINSIQMIEDIKQGITADQISVNRLVEGMFFVLGCDAEFRFCKDYLNIINLNRWTIDTVKGIIGQYVKDGNFKDVYILLRGLYLVEDTEEIFNNMLVTLKTLYTEDKTLEEEYNNIIDFGKEKGYPSAFFHESMLLCDNGRYSDAWDSLNLYFAQGGTSEVEILNYRNSLKLYADFENGQKKCVEDPKAALELLVPLTETMDDNAYLYLYIAVACRNLGLHEKAIYYLNEAFALDNSIADLYNEYGLNYASLKDFDTALNYFMKIFEATKDVGICTNIIMCYMSKGDNTNAKRYLEIAMEIDKDDEIVKEMQKMLGN